MVKKNIRQASVKISKNDDDYKQQHQQQFKSLIKVLRPKVYITDSSSFKNLVQELTGNGSSSSISTSSPPPPLPPLELPKVVQREDLEITGVQSQNGNEVVFGAEILEFEPPPNPNEVTTTTINSSGFCYPPLMHEEDFDVQVCNQMIMGLEEDTGFENLDDHALDSLLFEIEPSSFFYNCNAPQIEPEISIYDYEFSGLIN